MGMLLAISYSRSSFQLSDSTRNRQAINRRFIDVQAASRAEYYEAIANVSQHLNVRVYVLTFPRLARLELTH
jgi:hypothetical protein